MTQSLAVFSLGDPAGIGPEILLKAASAHVSTGRPGALVALAPVDLLRLVAQGLGLELPIVAGSVEDATPEALTVLPWPPTTTECHAPQASELLELPAHPGQLGGRAAWASLAAAVDLVLADPAHRALVTAPLSKAALAQAGFTFPGHTEYLGWRCGVADPLMWLDSLNLSVGLVSNHDPLFQLARALHPDRVERKARLALDFLRQHHPGEPLQVLALNPHAGDGGHLGREELEWLSPLVEGLRREGLPVAGPVPADGALAKCQGRFLAMYHDQGLPVFKAVAGMDGVNMTLGLPVVRTSPDHGTAFELAGGALADARSMGAALRRALELLEASR